MPFVGWDPLRVAALRDRCRLLRDDLRRLATLLDAHCDESPSDIGVRVVRGALDEWDRRLLPILDRVHGDAVAHVVHASLGVWAVDAAARLHVPPGPNRGDRMLVEVLADPWAAAGLLRLTAEDPSVLFDAAADPTLAHRIVATGLPLLATRDAERVVVALIEWYRAYELGHHPLDAGYDADWRPFLVDILSAHLLRFSPLDTEWATPPRRRAELLDRLLDDPVVLRLIVERRNEIVSHVAAALVTTHRSAAVEHLAAFLGLLASLLTRHHRADESLRLVAWQLAWAAASALGAAVGALAGGAGAAIGAKTGVMVLERATQRWAPDPERAARDDDYARRWMLATAAAATLAGLVSMSAGTAAPPRPVVGDADPVSGFLVRFARWRSGLPGGSDGALADRATRLVYTLISPADAGEEVAAAVDD